MRIPAAGTLPWRVRDGGLEVALVHRPRYDDWSWAKGKLDPGEEWPVAAARETDEETGLRVVLGVPLPDARTAARPRRHRPTRRSCGTGPRGSSAARGGSSTRSTRWRGWRPKEAHDRLDYSRDRDQLLALVRWHQAGLLDTRPLVLVRHARAMARSDWDGPDDTAARSTAPGRQRARGARPAARRLPAGAARQLALRPLRRDGRAVRLGHRRRGCGCGGACPRRASRRTRRRRAAHLDRLLAGDRAGAALLARAGVPQPARRAHRARAPRRRRRGGGPGPRRRREDRLGKGEALVCHLVGTGADARVVAVERHLP